MKEVLRFIEMWLIATAAIVLCETHSILFILPLTVAGTICWAIVVNDERKGGDE